MNETEQNLNAIKLFENFDCDGNNKLEKLLTQSAERVNQTELERLAAQREHEITSRAYSATEQRLSKLHQQLKRSIVKAR